MESRPAVAGEFYAVIVAATIGGVVLGFTPIDPIKALFWSADINGVISVPVLAVMLVASRSLPTASQTVPPRNQEFAMKLTRLTSKRLGLAGFALRVGPPRSNLRGSA